MRHDASHMMGKLALSRRSVMTWSVVVIAAAVMLALSQLVILVRRAQARRAAEDVWSAGAPESAHSRAKKAGAATTAGLISGCGGCGGCGCGG